MPIKIQDKLPARKILNKENIFVITEKRALKQDIRPLKILILNLMPTKIVTETQLLRLLGNTPLQVEIFLMNTMSHVSKNVSEEHLFSFYNTFDSYKDKKFDGMIITGAPVETLNFEDVDYYSELCEIMEWSKTNVTSTLHICWGAQAGLYYHYNIPKYNLPKKMFGVFPHNVKNKSCKLMRGFDDVFYAPHSRYTETKKEDVKLNQDLQILAESKIAGPFIISSKDRRQIFVSGHPEYDANTLGDEYTRDIGRGLNTEIPYNYFENDDPSNPPRMTWRSHANLLFSNWLNYYVYQTTPYILE